MSWMRRVPNVFIQPSQDLGEIAGDVLSSREVERALADRVASYAMRAAARGAFPDKDLLSYLLFDGAYTNRLVDLGRADAVAAMMVETWDMARLLVEARGGQFYLFLQPNAYVGKPNISYLKLDGRRAGRDRQFNAVYPLVRRKLEERQAKWAHDVSGAFDGDQKFYIDDAHVAQRGNRIVAELMRNVIAGGGR